MNRNQGIKISLAIGVAVLLLATTAFAGSTVEAKQKSKTGTIKVEFISVGSHGKAKLKIINERTDKVIVKADLNFDKQLKSQGDNCCKKTYEFKWNGNQIGDELTLKVKTIDQGTFESSGNLKSGTTHLGIDLNGDDDD